MRAPAPARPALGVRVRRAVLAAGACAALGALLYASAIPCTFARIFHAPCPGCGSTRAVLALLHGDLAEVVRMNPLGPAMALLLGVLGAQALVSVLVHGDFRGAGGGRLGRVVRCGVFVVVALQVVLWGARFFGFFGDPVPV